jgi:trimethylamine--corrinoid protein Co-methyltransferase
MLFDRDEAPRVLTDQQLDQVHDQAMRICEDIGLDVLHPDVRGWLELEGLPVEGERVFFDRGWLMEQVGKAPATFTLHARNPANSVEVGGGTPLWMNVGGPPFFSDLDRGRRNGSLEGHDTLVKLTHAARPLNCVQTGACEAIELPVHSRHLDMEYSTIRWSDLPYTTYGTSGPKSHDGVEMARIVHGGDLGERTVLLGIVNSVSPLIWDFRMVDAMKVWAEENQATVVTPFLLAGATAAVSVAAGLAQQVAEALTGIAMTQMIRPGAPVLYGSFFQATDMRSGAPAFGTPESIFGVFAGAQLARRYGLPFRGGGGLASSNVVDAQAGAEALMMLWATMLAGTDVVLHAAGWLEGGLTASLEKFALDVELLEQFLVQKQGIEFDDEHFAFDALAELGPGGLWLASEHTMEHFREWLYISPLFTTQDYTTWHAAGAETAEVRANRRWKELLASYEDPGIDPDVEAELLAFIDKRSSEPPPDEEG